MKRRNCRDFRRHLEHARRGPSLLLVVALAAGAACGAARADDVPDRTHLGLVANYDAQRGEGLEIVSAQELSGRAVVTLGAQGEIDVLDLTDPAAPRRLVRHQLPDAAGRLTCVAFHPRENWVLATILARDGFAPGRLLAVEATTGEILKTWPTGVGPDHVTFDPAGNHALIACEGEAVARAESGRGFVSARGSLTLLRCAQGPGTAQVVQIPLPDASGTEGITQAAHQRWIERVPSRPGSPGAAPGADGQARIRLDHAHDEWLEPEFCAFAPDGRLAYVTLQEHNAIAVVDVAAARVLRYIGLGTARHAADLRSDGAFRPDQVLFALREPDGVALTPNGQVLITADEGDTWPPAARTPPGLPSGGARSLTLYSAHSGKRLGDTGGGLDEAAWRARLYDDRRSGQRGCEPENPVAFVFGGVPYAAVGLERANAVALVCLRPASAPRVLGAWSVGPRSVGPEGLALLRRGAATYVLVANEVSGDLSVFEVRR